MKDFYSISEAAKIVNMTSETLRHYDRVDLIKPSKVDEVSGYRYYSEREIIYLQIIGLLRQVDFSISEIKEMIKINDFEVIIESISKAEDKANEEIKRLEGVKQELRLARRDYERKFQQISENKTFGEVFIAKIPQRAIMIAEDLKEANVKNLWKFHDYFYEKIDDSLRDKIIFEDSAGIIIRRNESYLFAVCKKYIVNNYITFLPEGEYLCAYCTEDNKEAIIEELIEKAKSEYDVECDFIVQDIVFTGMLQWKYEIQIYLK